MSRSRTHLASVSDGELMVAQRALALHDILLDWTNAQRIELYDHWHTWARGEQQEPPGDWRIWLIMAGRGFGKTRAGAEWVRDVAVRDAQARIALVAANIHEARAVMVEGASGILAVTPERDLPHYEPSLRRLQWRNGAKATLYSAAEPEQMRGAQHSHAWCDEIAKWDASSYAQSSRAEAAWDNMMMGLRAGRHPQVVATTTPRAVPLVRKLAGGKTGLPDGTCVVTRGPTFANANNLPQSYIDMMLESYGESQLGRQELDGELIIDVEGALWSRKLLARCRLASPLPPAEETAGGPVREITPPESSAPNPSRRRAGLKEDYTRIVVAVDPPAGKGGDACGIVVAGLCADGCAHVLADCSAEKAAPNVWAAATANAAEIWGADRVVAEANQGGEMVRATLAAAGRNLPLRLVHASRGKTARAEPVAALYEAGRVFHAGTFAALEDQMCGLMAGGGYTGPGRSPDRADALVWALTELMLVRRAEPRVWVV